MTDFGLEIHDLPASRRLMIEGELRGGEELRWVGHPAPGRLARRGLPIAVFGVLWTAFALFWTASAAGFRFPSFNSGASLFPLFGIPLILIGLGMLAAPFFMGRRAHRIAYAVTDRRVIVITGGLRSTTIQSLAPFELRGLRRVERADGSGDLLFGRLLPTEDGKPTGSGVAGFLAVPDVKAVEDLVRELIETHGAAAPGARGE